MSDVEENPYRSPHTSIALGQSSIVRRLASVLAFGIFGFILFNGLIFLGALFFAESEYSDESLSERFIHAAMKFIITSLYVGAWFAAARMIDNVSPTSFGFFRSFACVGASGVAGVVASMIVSHCIGLDGRAFSPEREALFMGLTIAIPSFFTIAMTLYRMSSGFSSA